MNMIGDTANAEGFHLLFPCDHGGGGPDEEPELVPAPDDGLNVTSEFKNLFVRKEVKI